MPLPIQTNQKRQNLKQQVNYKQCIKHRFCAQVKTIVDKYNLQELILVLDLNTTLLISNLFKIPQLVQMKITFLERLEVKRKKLPQLHALYLISPNQLNITCLLNDFKQAPYQYKKVHLLFTTFMPSPLLKQIATNKSLLKRIAVNSIKEFYHSGKFLQNNLVNFGLPYGKKAFGKQGQEQISMRVRIANSIMEFVVGFAEISNVKIYYKKSNNVIAQNVAEYTQKAIDKYIANLLQAKSHLIKKDADDITLMIFDRSIDPITPLIHGFSYQAMLFDLVKVAFQGTQKVQDKQYYEFSSFNDQIYNSYRYSHISKALQQLPLLLKKQNQKLSQLSNPTSSTSPQNQVNLTQLNQVISSLRKHIDILDILWKQFKIKGLDKIGELEQCLTTGLTDEGKNTSSTQLYNQVIQIVSNNHNTTKDEKLRLALLVLATIKLSKKDYQNLLDKFQNNQADKWALKNIISLGVTYDKKISKSTKAISKQQQNIALKRLQETGMPLDRYTSILQLILPMTLQILQGCNQKVTKLDSSIFGQLSSSPIPNNSFPKFNKEKFAVIMLGGLSFMEISALRKIDRLKYVLFGVDQVLSPDGYLNMLRDIDILK